MESVWIEKTIDPNDVKYIQKEFNLPEIYARVMALRGIRTRSDSRKFFYTSDDHLHDPFMMKGMDEAVSRLIRQIRDGKPILVFGDYDVDGTTGTAMLYLFLKDLGADVHFYIPLREIEGYGVSQKGIDYAHSIGATLMITCDCGINAVDKVDYANELGIDVIITDHHRPDKKLPEAFAILNPTQPDCPYPFKGLCGAGVAFKFALAVCEKSGKDPALVWQHADLIALGIAADLVPVVDENRIIIERGLKSISRGEKVGIKALMITSGLWDKTLTVGKMVFWLAPKINAAGRLGDAARAVRLLTTSNPVFATRLAKELEVENKKRQDITSLIIDEAVQMVNSVCDLENDHAIVLASSGWHAGVIGIVASRIRELYNRPVFIISIHRDGTGKGSGRSIPSFDLYEALRRCSHTLTGFGGHPIAAGITVDVRRIEQFRDAFIKLANEQITKKEMTHCIFYDGQMPISQIDGRFIRFLNALSPFGPGNMRPKFISKNIRVNGMPRVLGKDRDTIKFNVKDGRTEFEVIGFKMIDHYEKLLMNKPVHIAYEIGENEWNGNRTIQLELKDIKIGNTTND